MNCEARKRYWLCSNRDTTHQQLPKGSEENNKVTVLFESSFESQTSNLPLDARSFCNLSTVTQT